MRHISCLLVIFIFLVGCSTVRVSTSFEEYAESTTRISTNVIQSFEQLQQEELNVKLLKNLYKDEVTRQDFTPEIITNELIQIRRNLLSSFSNYLNILAAILKGEKTDSLKNRVKALEADLLAIRKNHEDFLSENEITIFSTIAVSISDALTYEKRVHTVRSTMKKTDPIIKKMAELLKDELASAQSLFFKYYSDQFRTIIFKVWKDSPEKREKIGKQAVQMVTNEKQMAALIKATISALDSITAVHHELANQLDKNIISPQSLLELLEYSYQIKQIMQTITQD